MMTKDIANSSYYYYKNNMSLFPQPQLMLTPPRPSLASVHLFFVFSECDSDPPLNQLGHSYIIIIYRVHSLPAAALWNAWAHDPSCPSLAAHASVPHFFSPFRTQLVDSVGGDRPPNPLLITTDNAKMMEGSDLEDNSPSAADNGETKFYWLCRLHV
jgi:hypothetical protein